MNVFINNCIYGDATGSIRVANYEHKIENIGDEKKLSPVIYKALNMTIQEIKDERDERDETIEIVNDLAKLDIAKPSPRKPTVKGGKAVAPSGNFHAKTFNHTHSLTHSLTH